MKNFFLLIWFFIQLQNCIAQEFYGKAIYISKNKTSEIDFGPNVSQEAKNKLLERISEASSQFYTLEFNKSASIYEEDITLGAPGSKMTVTRTSSTLDDQSGKIYKDVKNKLLLIEKEFLGKSFLIKDTLPTLQWELTNETKKIGDYICYKAITTESDTGIEEYISSKLNKENKSFEVSDNKESNAITAWYTPDIPVNQGPRNYWGLPGLILEINTSNTVILCNKIIISPNKNYQISIPNKGKKVAIEEYYKIVLNKLQEMENME